MGKKDESERPYNPHAKLLLDKPLHLPLRAHTHADKDDADDDVDDDETTTTTKSNHFKCLHKYTEHIARICREQHTACRWIFPFNRVHNNTVWA